MHRAWSLIGCLALSAGVSAAATMLPLVEHGKPAPDVYSLAAQRLGVPAEHCLAVEDSGPGAASAHAAGMFVLGVLRNPGEAGRLLEAGAAIVDSLDAEILLGLVR